jgi:malonate-semialdehyde dehydrogenase (acetylating) / methylmalonate-semialdehyde dehydrogenase
MSIVTGGSTLMRNYVNGDWVASSAADSVPVLNPATGDQLGTTPLSTASDVAQAVDAASRAFPAWRRVPVIDRVQFLFKLKEQLERHFDEISRTRG